MKKSYLLHWIIGLLITTTSFAQQNVYMFSYFKNNGQDGLHLAYSEDGYQWHALKNDSSFLTPEVSADKLMRDPCIIHGPDGVFRMVWTVSWTDKGIGYSSSKDLIHWTKQQFIPVMAKESNVRNCWAPEITYDKKTKEYMIYWASTIRNLYPIKEQESEDKYNHRIYYVTTKDFEHFSDTKMLYNKGFNVIDATIVPIKNKFIMFMKNEGLHPVEKNIRIAYSKHLTGPYSEASKPITGKYWAEGPTVVRVNGSWIVYFDKYSEGKYGAIKSDDLVNWTDISNEISVPKGLRHGSIFTAPASILKTIKK